MSQSLSKGGKRCCRNSPWDFRGTNPEGIHGICCSFSKRMWNSGSAAKNESFQHVQFQALTFPHFCVLQDTPLIRDKIQYLGDKTQYLGDSIQYLGDNIQYLVVKGFWHGRKPRFHTVILLELHSGGRAGTLTMDKEFSKARCGMLSSRNLY